MGEEERYDERIESYVEDWDEETWDMLESEVGLGKADKYILGELREFRNLIPGLMSKGELSEALDAIKSELEYTRSQFNILLVMVGIIGVLVFLGL